MVDRYAMALLLAVAALPGCQGDAQPDRVTVTDSAGVRISISPAAARVFAEVDSMPLLGLGGADARGPTQFSNVRGVHVDPDGRIWVADGGSGELRIFRSDGSHWKTVGGEGAGPGEFRRIRLLGAFRGDSVALWDDANPRLTILDPDGDLARTVGPASGNDSSPRAFAVFGDGTLLAREVRVLYAGSLEPGEVFADTAWLVRVDIAGGTREPQGRAPGQVWLWTGRNQIPIPFTINPGFDLVGDAVHVVAGPEFRVQVFENGRLAEVYGVDRAPREVTSEAVATYREFFERAMPASTLRKAYLSTLGHPRQPTLQPGYDRVLAADNGNVWARVYSPDRSSSAVWDVFGRNREWLGQVRTPAGFVPYAIAGTTLVGVWRDGLGVEHIRAYRLIARTAPSSAEAHGRAKVRSSRWLGLQSPNSRTAAHTATTVLPARGALPGVPVRRAPNCAWD